MSWLVSSAWWKKESSAGVGLERRRGKAKRFKSGAGGVNGLDARPAGHVHLEATGTLDLGHQVHVGQRRRVTEAEATPTGIAGQQGLERIEAGRDPAGAPRVDGCLVGAEGRAQGRQDA